MTKMVLSEPDSGKSYQIELDDKKMDKIIGKKVGETLSGDILGLSGYEVKLTGGSDKDGFPMRKDLSGMRRPKILLRGGPGYRPKEKGLIRRKRVRSNTYVKEISQINAVVVKKGSKELEELVAAMKKKQE